MLRRPTIIIIIIIILITVQKSMQIIASAQVYYIVYIYQELIKVVQWNSV